MGEQYIDVDQAELRSQASKLDSTTVALSALATAAGSPGLHPTGPVTGDSAPSAALVAALTAFETAWPAALKTMAIHTTAIAGAMRDAAAGYTAVDLLPPLAAAPPTLPRSGSR